MTNQTTTDTTSTTTIDERNQAIRKQIVKRSRIADATTELEFARKQIRQVSICLRSLLHAGLSNEEADSLLKSLRSIDQAITSAASDAQRNAMVAEEDLLDLVAGLSK
tara:strand:+ start:235 stop:558 length:324 start_codon:yes stop_codon:yes gene_type:complete